MGGASGMASSRALETGRGSMPSSRRAHTTPGLRRSTCARQPSYSRYVVAAPSDRGVTKTFGWLSRSSKSSIRPAITVVVVASQTVHAVSSPDRGLAMTAGAPGMPRSGPRFALSISAGLTTCGRAALPVAKRADAKFRTGCSVSSMRTYSAPESRDMTITASPHPAFGRRNARIAHPATTTIARTQPAMSESDCVRIGSCSIRMSPRSSACSIRRTRNRYPLTCSRVVG